MILKIDIFENMVNAKPTHTCDLFGTEILMYCKSGYRYLCWWVGTRFLWSNIAYPVPVTSVNFPCALLTTVTVKCKLKKKHPLFLCAQDACHNFFDFNSNGEAIQLDENLLHCRTEHCDTFDNPPLCSDQDFTCKVVEVYGFQ